MSKYPSIGINFDISTLNEMLRALDEFRRSAKDAKGASDGLGDGFNSSSKDMDMFSKAMEYAITKNKQWVDSLRAVNPSKLSGASDFEIQKIREIKALKDAGASLSEYKAIKDEVSKAEKSSLIIGSQAKNLQDLIASASKQANEENRKSVSIIETKIRAIQSVNGATKKLADIEAQLDDYRQKGLITEASHARLLERVSEKSKAMELAQKANLKAKSEFIKKLQEEVFLLGASSEQIALYKAQQLGIRKEVEPLINQITRYNDKLKQRQIEEREATRASKEAEREASRLKSSQDSFINSLQRQVNAIGKSKTELLQLKAVELGVADKAKPLIKALDEQSKKLKETSNNSKDLSGSLSGIPSQIGDIINQLGAGNSSLSNFLSMGSGAGGSIGSIGNSIKSMLPVLTPVSVGLTAVAGATMALGVAIHQGDAEHREFNKQLILSGRYAQRTVGELSVLAREYKSLGVAQFESAEALAKVVGSGRFARQEINLVASSAITLKRVIGQSIDETVSQFARIKDDPVNAIRELDREMNFLTASEYKRIIQLEDMGRKEDAARLASQAYAESIRTGANEIDENLGFLESAWRGVSLMAKRAWDAMLDVGRKQTTKEQIKDIEETLVNFQLNKGAEGVYFAKTGEMKSDLEARLAKLREKDYQESKKAQDEALLKQEEENNKKRIENERALIQKYGSMDQRYKIEKEQILNDIYTSEKAKKDAIAQLDLRYARQKASLDNFQNKQVKPGAGTREDMLANEALISLKTQLKVITEQSDATSKMSNERKKLYEMQAKFAVLEEEQGKRALDRNERALLSAKDTVLARHEEMAVIGDQIKLLNEKIALNKKDAEKAKEIADRTRALNNSIGKSDREQKRDKERESADPKARQALEEFYDAEDAKRQNWIGGFKQGFAEFKETATDAYGAMRSVSSAVFDGIANQLSQMLLTGKASFKEFTASILSMLTEILVKMMMVKAIEASGIGFAGGGYTGNGGKYEPAGTVHKGEFVFTKESTKRLGVGNLYALMRGADPASLSGNSRNGYANGGLVGNQSLISRMPTNVGGSVMMPIEVNIVGNGGGNQGSGNIDTQAMKNEVEGQVTMVINGLINNPNSSLSQFVNGGRR